MKKQEMKNLNGKARQTGPGAKFQQGIVTTFTGVLILLLLTIMMFFAMRVGVFDQRSSSNDMRQKLAFHTAESGIHHAKEFFRANSVIVASPLEDILPNGTDGWLSSAAVDAAAGTPRWLPCDGAPGVDVDNPDARGSHPCYGESVWDRRKNLYYYSSAKPASDDSIFVPIDTDNKVPGTNETVGVQALLCVLNVKFGDEHPVKGCSTNTTIKEEVDTYVDGSHYMITLLARGEGDCVGTDCRSEALVSEQMSNFGVVAGGQAPSVPLTTKSTFPPSGSAEVVPNPNSGGVGVPVSVWMNANTSCPTGSVVDPSSGSWATCEMQEWYGEDALPADYTCNGNCACTKDESLSYTHAGSNVLGIDLVSDPNFPCDLFEFYFGVPKTSYELVKSYAKVLNDCDTLGPNSTGIYWITGSDCRINSNTVVGAPYAPVMLISAATTTTLNGNATIYGIMYITDAENANAELDVKGTNTVYGQVVVDATLASYTGTFQVVYNENTIGKASGGGGLGTLIGGWADFHKGWE